jgi:hypothetical protein
MLGEDVLFDIDATLDSLIKNAEVLNEVSLKDLSEEEVMAFHKTQESLLNHLVSMDTMLEQKRKSIKKPDKRSVQYNIQEKLLKFKKINKDL